MAWEVVARSVVCIVCDFNVHCRSRTSNHSTAVSDCCPVLHSLRLGGSSNLQGQDGSSRVSWTSFFRPLRQALTHSLTCLSQLRYRSPAIVVSPPFCGYRNATSNRPKGIDLSSPPQLDGHRACRPSSWMNGTPFLHASFPFLPLRSSSPLRLTRASPIGTAATPPP